LSEGASYGFLKNFDYGPNTPDLKSSEYHCARLCGTSTSCWQSLHWW